MSARPTRRASRFRHRSLATAKKTAASSGAVREAVKKVGNSRGKVEAELKK